MGYRKKTVGKILDVSSAVLGMLGAFGLGHAVKGINSETICTTVTQISPGFMASVCGAAQTATNVFTTAAANTTVTAMECVPYLNLDSNLVAACFAPLSGITALGLGGIALSFYLKRKASH